MNAGQNFAIDMPERKVYNTRSRSRGKSPDMPTAGTDLYVNDGLAHMSYPNSTEEDIKMTLLHDEKDKEEKEGPGICSKSLGKDKYNIALLMFLYVLQGIPLGLAGAVPYLLQTRKVNYKEQAVFSFVYWPFSVKLLWAPIVDAVYWQRFGRRKSWLVPIQYLLGLFMLVLSPYIPDLMGETPGSAEVNVNTLTFVFFALNFLAATQDIAVDGWALTMLAR